MIVLDATAESMIFLRNDCVAIARQRTMFYAPTAANPDPCH